MTPSLAEGFRRRMFADHASDWERRPAFAFGVIVLFFAATRALVAYAFHLRGLSLPASDGRAYVMIAEYLAEHGRLPTEGRHEWRQFPGLSYLILAVSMVLGDKVLSGFVVHFAGGLGALLFFQWRYGSLRLTLLLAIFLPSWISANIMTEGLSMLLLLLAIEVFQRLRHDGWAMVGALVAGYGLVVRETMVLCLMPIALAGLLRQETRADQWWFLVRGLVFGLPLMLQLLWAKATTGVIHPNAEAQLAYTISQSRGYFPERLLTFPGHSLLLGLTDPKANLLKSASVVAHLAVTVMALLVAWRRSRVAAGAERALLASVAAGIGLHLAFHLCVGGPWGYNTLDRYLAQISPLLLIAVWGLGELRWRWLLPLAVVCLLYASNTGAGPSILK
jgi:hypothetical protein